MTTAESIAASGYVRFPNAWLRLPLSPGAKCLLMHFCGTADETGASWYSFSQLADLLGRSRSSISAYVAELRDADLIVTERQKTANGFNYRLRIRVREWTSILDSWRTRRGAAEEPGDRGTERSVRKTERMNPKGSNTESKKLTSTPTSRSFQDPAAKARPRSRPVFPVDLEDEWTGCFAHPGDATPSRPPSNSLLEAVIAHADALRRHHSAFTPEEARSAAAEAIDAFVKRRRLETPSSDERTRLSTMIAKHAPTSRSMAEAFSALDAEWKPHWRRPPSPAQLEAWLKQRMPTTGSRSKELSDLRRFENRALRARCELEARRNASPPDAPSRDGPAPGA